MKTLLAIVIVCCGLMKQPAWGQSKEKNRVYRVWVVTEDPKNMVKGYVYDLKDSSIVISNIALNEQGYIPNFMEVKIDEIEHLRFRRKNSVGSGILLGVSAGILVGTVVGALDNTFFSPFTTALGGGYLGILPGALKGTFKTGISINCKQSNYKKEELLKYQLKP